MNRSKNGVATAYTYVGMTQEEASASDPTGVSTFAQVPGGPLAQRRASTTRYLLADLHGDVVGLVDTAGSLVGTKAMSPWGEPRSVTGETSTFGFQGDPTDADTGLVDMTSRDYDPALGRFNTRDVVFGDPVRPSSLNQFTYGFANPVTTSDPTGMFPLNETCGNCWPGYFCDGPCSNPPPGPATYPDYGHGGSTAHTGGMAGNSVPIPVLSVGDYHVSAKNLKIALNLLRFLSSLSKEQLSVAVRGMAHDAQSKSVLVTSFNTRNQRAGLVGFDPQLCHGLTECTQIGAGTVLTGLLDTAIREAERQGKWSILRQFKLIGIGLAFAQGCAQEHSNVGCAVHGLLDLGAAEGGCVIGAMLIPFAAPGGCALGATLAILHADRLVDSIREAVGAFDVPIPSGCEQSAARTLYIEATGGALGLGMFSPKSAREYWMYGPMPYFSPQYYC
jgi:RHS repeat-associated protein